MSIDLGKQIVTITERTWRIEIETERGDDPVIRVFREKLTMAEDGTVLLRDRDLPVVGRRLSEITDQKVAVGAASYTGSEVAAVIAAMADAFRQQDIETAASAAAPPSA